MKLPSNRRQANQGIQQIVIKIYMYLHTLWLTRNTHSHGTDINNMDSYKRLQLLHEIQNMYTNKDHMLSSDRDIFNLPFNTRNEFYNVNQLQSFINANKNIMKQSMKDALYLRNDFQKIPFYFPKLRRPQQKPKIINKPPPELDP